MYYKKLIHKTGDALCLQADDLKSYGVVLRVEAPWPVHLPQMFGCFSSCVQWGDDVQALQL
jgi:hypothetical protein